MYRNNCVNEEKTSDPNPANHKVAPRPPCRSFCVQVRHWRGIRVILFDLTL